MKSILFVAVFGLAIAACDTPQKTTTGSGTGSDTATNRSTTTDTTTNRADSTRQQ